MPKKGGLSWRPLAAVVVIVVIVAAALLLTQQRGQEGQEGQPGPAGEEYVWVAYVTDFRLLQTSDNEAIENLRLGFSYPYIPPAQWTTTDNSAEVAQESLEIPFENIEVIFNFGERTENRNNPTISPVVENWTFGGSAPVENCIYRVPGLFFEFSQGRIYPGDNFYIKAWLKVPSEDVQKLTVAMGDNVSVGLNWWDPDTTIGFVSWIDLFYRENGEIQRLERWGTQHDNGVHRVIVAFMVKEL